MFLGEGFAREKVSNTKRLEGNEYRGQRADHAVFAKAYYAYGLLTSLSIILLFGLLANYTFKLISKSSNNNLFSSKFTRIIFVLLLGFSSWFAFGHAAVSQPRGTMLMFFVFGLVASQKNKIRESNIATQIEVLKPASLQKQEQKQAKAG